MPTSTIVQEARAREVPFTNNLLTNPGFEIWQRGNGPFTVGGTFTADEWKMQDAGGSMSLQQSSTHLFGDYSLRVSSFTSIGTASQIVQGIEAAKSLEDRWMTFSAWVKSPAAGIATLVIADYASAQEAESSEPHPGDSQWHLLTVTKKVQTGLTAGPDANWPHSYPLRVYLRIADTATEIYMDGAVCAAGYFPEGLMYVPPNPAQDMLRCERYYQVGSPGSWAGIPSGSWKVLATGSWFYISTPFYCPMAATPTVTAVNYSNDGRFGTTSTVWCNGNKGFWTGRQSIATGNRGYFGDSWTAEVT